MAYSKAFREGLEDSVSKLRWRAETHLHAHLTPHPEESPATRGELSKMLVVLTDALENFISEVVGYLEHELGKPQASGGGAAPKGAGTTRPKGKTRAAARKPAAAKRRRR